MNAPKNITSVVIRAARNGYTADCTAYEPGMQREDPYVFESIRTLFDWLGDNLSEPLDTVLDRHADE